jgi:hypothetical protein
MPSVASTAFASAQEGLSLVRSMLNDADIPSIWNISPTGAVRASNVVTITTTSAHGLVIGDRVTVLSTLDATFEGTFTVLATPSTMSFQYAQTAGNATSGMGTVELLIQGDVFSDSVLLPFLNKGYRKVQRQLGARGAKSMTSEIELTLKAGDTGFFDTVSGSGSSPLPDDFLAPRTLKEKALGSSDRYIPMHDPVDQIPDVPQQATLQGLWSWREDAIYFIGATSDRSVLLRYFRAVANLTGPSSVIAIRGGLDAVASAAAMYAAASRGAANVGYFATLFETDFRELTSIDAHARQYRSSRRQPYNAFRGR